MGGMIMKKIAIILIAAAATLVSCQKEVVYDGEMTKISFTVKREAPTSDSKAVLSGTSVVFEDNDNLSVFDGTYTNYLFETTKGGDEAVFTGSAGSAASYLIASPYNDSYSQVSTSVLQYTIPDVQVATPGSADPNALICIGKGVKGSAVTLYNAVALVEIEVPAGLTVKNIQIGGGRGSSIGICGTFKFNANDQIITEAVSMSSVVTLVPQDGQATIAPGTYYVAVRPKPDYEGLTVAYVNGSNQLCKRQTVSGHPMIYINRGHILPLGSLDEVNYSPITGTAVLRYFGDEPQFTGRVKKLAGGSGSATADDNVIRKIVFKAHTLYSQAYKQDSYVVSNGGLSTVQIHAFMNGDVLYVCTEAPIINFYPGVGGTTSANLMRNFVALEEVEFSDISAMPNTSLEYLFRNNTSLRKVDFGSADLANVTNWSYTFMTANMGTSVPSSLEHVSLGKTATTSATTMASMFSQAVNMRYLDFGPNFTLAETINGMFNGTASSTTSVYSLQCKLFASQSMYDTLTAELNGDGVNLTTLFNKWRFFFTPVE